MSPILYALIGALIFAIAHGMHFAVAPLPGGQMHVTTLTAPSKPDDITTRVTDDIRLAFIRY